MLYLKLNVSNMSLNRLRDLIAVLKARIDSLHPNGSSRVVKDMVVEYFYGCCTLVVVEEITSSGRDN